VLGIAGLELPSAEAAPGTFTGGTLVNLGTFDGATSGRNPLGPVVMDASGNDGDGNLFGSANSGGSNDDGTVFELPKGSSAITPLAQIP
jgi:uncharacterized repeat protein (TIGR03803 family)